MRTTARSFRRLYTGLTFLGVATLAGCDKDGLTPLEPVVAAPEQAHNASAEHTAVDEVTRAIALALQDKGLRQRVLNDLRNSRVSHERKLLFSDYVRGQSGGILLAKMRSHTGHSAEDLLRIVETLRELEFYMPVEAHRATWTGGPELIVAWQLLEREDPVGYRLDGSAVALSNAAAPATPVLALVTREADFSKEVSADWAVVDDQGGRAIGTLLAPGGRRHVRNADGSGRIMVGAPSSLPSGWSASVQQGDCDDPTVRVCPGGGEPVTPVTYPAGVYLHYANINDLGESWVRGDPEIEIKVIGPTYHATSNGEQISCSGQGASGAKHFDMNNHTWSKSRWSVQGQILAKAQVDSFYTIYNAPYSLQLWEDDDRPCEVVFSGRSQIEQLYDNLMAAQRFTTLTMRLLSPPSDPLAPIRLDPGLGYAIRVAFTSMFQSDDDFLGNAEFNPATRRTDSYGDTYMDANLVLLNGNSNGSITVRTSDYAHTH